MNLITNDTELVQKLKTSDVKAFDCLYEKYSGKIYSFGLKYLRSTDETEELVQTIFLKLWENRKHLDKNLSVKAYIFTIAYNDICKLFRKRNYHQKFINDALHENSGSSSETEAGIEFRSFLSRVYGIIKMLPEKQKLIFCKSKLEGKSAKEISMELGLSTGTVDNYVSETLKFIRNNLRREDLV